MRKNAPLWIALSFCLLIGWTAGQHVAGQTDVVQLTAIPGGKRVYLGACDASGAVAIDADRFVVCDDEDNVLRVYDLVAGGPPLHEWDWSDVLGIEDGQEADFEGAERIGDLVYWISSHGRNRAGKERTARQRLFATRIHVDEGGVELEPVGEPYSRLLEDLSNAPALQEYALADAATRGPKDPGGLNVEALCAGPDGALWIGLRNPTAGGRALLIPLENPRAVLHGERARLGRPFELELDGLGLRSMERWRARGIYLIVAGPEASGGPFRLYTWSGDAADRPVAVTNLELGDLRPESLVIPLWEPERDDALAAGEVVLLSDDGGLTVGGNRCKELDAAQRRFRGLVVRLERSGGR